MRGNNKTEVNLHFLSNSLYLEKNIILLKTKIKQQNKRESAKRHKHYFLVHCMEIAMWIRYMSKPF